MANANDGERIATMAKELWETVLSDTEMSEMVRKNKLTVSTEFSEPEAYIWISPDEVIIGEEAKKDSIIKLHMTWEVGNDLYSDNIGLTPAISSGKVKVRGPLLKLMKIVPLLKRAQTIWPDVCKKYDA